MDLNKQNSAEQGDCEGENRDLTGLFVLEHVYHLRGNEDFEVCNRTKSLNIHRVEGTLNSQVSTTNYIFTLFQF